MAKTGFPVKINGRNYQSIVDAATDLVIPVNAIRRRLPLRKDPLEVQELELEKVVTRFWDGVIIYDKHEYTLQKFQNSQMLTLHDCIILLNRLADWITQDRIEIKPFLFCKKCNLPKLHDCFTYQQTKAELPVCKICLDYYGKGAIYYKKSKANKVKCLGYCNKEFLTMKRWNRICPECREKQKLRSYDEYGIMR